MIQSKNFCSKNAHKNTAVESHFMALPITSLLHLHMLRNKVLFAYLSFLHSQPPPLCCLSLLFNYQGAFFSCQLLSIAASPLHTRFRQHIVNFW
jgi:hypothetical protein